MNTKESAISSFNDDAVIAFLAVVVGRTTNTETRNDDGDDVIGEGGSSAQSDARSEGEPPIYVPLPPLIHRVDFLYFHQI